MRANRCVWVRWGAGGMRNTKTRQAGGNNGVTGQNQGPMAGEISPDIMFGGVCQKSDTRGCMCVQIDLNGCNRANSHGEEQKEGKKKLNWMRRAYFSMHVHSAKKTGCRKGQTW